jgi:hypothetical protein
MTATLITIILGVIGSIIAAEFLGWCPWLAERLVNLAVLRLGDTHRDRYRDEWSADMDVLRTRGNVSLLIWAIGLYLVAGRVASALQPTPIKELRENLRPTLAETTRVSKFALEQARTLRLASVNERLVTHPSLRPIMLPFCSWVLWAGARLDRHICDKVRKLVKIVDRSVSY